MRLLGLLALQHCLLSHAANIVIGNDDGWAEINIRAFYDSLKQTGNKAIVSAPATDKSGSGSTDLPPTPLLFGPCEFDSCPRGSPAIGKNASDPNLNYVNSFPVTAIDYGIKTLAPTLLGGPPDIAVTGFNVGANLELSVPFSGTVGAATSAVKLGIPTVAFSGSTGTKTAWNAPEEPYVGIYADLATNFTNTLIATGKPYLPSNVWLNVNFGAVGGAAGCDAAGKYKFVLTRIYPAVPVVTPDDVQTCGSKRLPRESDVVKRTDGCYASVSVGKADNKLDASRDQQAAVLAKLGGFLSCLPN